MTEQTATKVIRSVQPGEPSPKGTIWRDGVLHCEIKKRLFIHRWLGDTSTVYRLFEAEVRRTPSGRFGYRGLIKKEGDVKDITAWVRFRSPGESDLSPRLVDHRRERADDPDTIARDVISTSPAEYLKDICCWKELQVETEWRRFELVALFENHDQVVTAAMLLVGEGVGNLLLKDIEIIE